VAVLLETRRSNSSSFAHPKASALVVIYFPLQIGNFWGAAMGAMGADHGPRSWQAVASVRQLAAEAMPPLWQYFERL